VDVGLRLTALLPVIPSSMFRRKKREKGERGTLARGRLFRGLKPSTEFLIRIRKFEIMETVRREKQKRKKEKRTLLRAASRVINRAKLRVRVSNLVRDPPIVEKRREGGKGRACADATSSMKSNQRGCSISSSI